MKVRLSIQVEHNKSGKIIRLITLHERCSDCVYIYCIFKVLWNNSLGPIGLVDYVHVCFLRIRPALETKLVKLISAKS